MRNALSWRDALPNETRHRLLWDLRLTANRALRGSRRRLATDMPLRSGGATIRDCKCGAASGDGVCIMHSPNSMTR
jgi:hypothetical protein